MQKSREHAVISNSCRETVYIQVAKMTSSNDDGDEIKTIEKRATEIRARFQSFASLLKKQKDETHQHEQHKRWGDSKMATRL